MSYFRGWRIVRDDEEIKDGDYWIREGVDLSGFKSPIEIGDRAGLSVGKQLGPYKKNYLLKENFKYPFILYRKDSAFIPRRLALNRCFSRPLPLP